MIHLRLSGKPTPDNLYPQTPIFTTFTFFASCLFRLIMRRGSRQPQKTYGQITLDKQFYAHYNLIATLHKFNRTRTILRRYLVVQWNLFLLGHNMPAKKKTPVKPKPATAKKKSPKKKNEKPPTPRTTPSHGNITLAQVKEVVNGIIESKLSSHENKIDNKIDRIEKKIESRKESRQTSAKVEQAQIESFDYENLKSVIREAKDISFLSSDELIDLVDQAQKENISIDDIARLSKIWLQKKQALKVVAKQGRRADKLAKLIEQYELELLAQMRSKIESPAIVIKKSTEQRKIEVDFISELARAAGVNFSSKEAFAKDESLRIAYDNLSDAIAAA